MKHKILIILIIIFSGIYAQKSTYIYIPKEIQKAIKKQTRNLDGIPGKNYFINKTDYKIKVNFNPDTRKINGNEIITYTNNSSDTLDILYLNVYMDLFKKGNARDWTIGDIDITDGVKVTKVKVNNNEIKIENNTVRTHSAMLTIKPQSAILPKSENTIEIEWNFTYQGTITIRGGQYGDKNFLLSYWYPKMAVYDDIFGWNRRGHTGVQEFYNDFGDFDVEITVPAEYNVWSTAILQNTEDIYTQKYIDRINKSKSSDKIIHIITKEDRIKNDILKKAKNRVWKFKSENTPDIAFGISKSFLWDATSIMSGNRKIWVNTAYKENSADFKDVAEISRNAIKFFTNEIPGIPYPYPQFTAFNGGGGMEFPGMVNDGDNSNYNGTLYLTAHEMGHSYFPFYTGLNEQKYAWMDEGLITFFPKMFVEKFTKDKNYVFYKEIVNGYNRLSNTMLDTPPMITSDNLSSQAYRFNAYTRSSTAFYELYKYIGKQKFSKGLQLFAERWNGKHPTPYDFFFTFNEAVGEDLAWFWKPWFFEIGSADLSLGKLDNAKEKTSITIENKSGFPVEINLTVTYFNGNIKNYNYKSNVWKNTKSFKINLDSSNVKSIILDSEKTPDSNPKNNKLIFK